jgi:hypothetical protein
MVALNRIERLNLIAKLLAFLLNVLDHCEVHS